MVLVHLYIVAMFKLRKMYGFAYLPYTCPIPQQKGIIEGVYSISLSKNWRRGVQAIAYLMSSPSQLQHKLSNRMDRY